MNDIDYSFDWKGFNFFLKTAVICMVVGVFAHYSFLYASSYFVPTVYVASRATSSYGLVAFQRSVPTAAATQTSRRVINSLSIADTIPTEGKFIAADLVNMKLLLYKDGSLADEFPIVTKGKPGTPWETPSGFYSIQTKEETHFSSIGHVYMPYSMQFYGNYFIHGWTYYPDGTPVSASFSGGCIKLSTEDAKQVFAFADIGTKLFVYDPKQIIPPAPLALDMVSKPDVSAAAYLVADIDTGDVYAEHNAQSERSIASVTKLMTALVANEVISLDKKVSVREGELLNPQDSVNVTKKFFFVNDLFYPLLMQSSNLIAESFADYYGKSGFLQWMNTTARALDMTSTIYADASGVSPDNVSTAEDLFRLAVYLTNKKSFVFNITRMQSKTIAAEDGSTYQIENLNMPDDIGNKVDYTTVASNTMASVLLVKAGVDTNRVAVIVLGSSDQTRDAKHLVDWVGNTKQGALQAACVSCAESLPYRKIKL